MIEAGVERAGFRGFSPAGLSLLARLAADNGGPWWEAHRSEYHRLLLEPARALVLELGARMRRAVPGIRAEPRVGGSILRPHLDARFSGLSPLRAHLEIWLWEGERSSRHHPGFFLRLEPSGLVLGGGLRRFPPEVRSQFRHAVDHPARALALGGLLGPLQGSGWTIGGRTLRRPPSPYPRDHPRADLLRHSGLWVGRSGGLPEALFTPQLARLLAGEYRALVPLHLWLVELCRAAAADPARPAGPSAPGDPA